MFAISDFWIRFRDVLRGVSVVWVSVLLTAVLLIAVLAVDQIQEVLIDATERGSTRLVFLLIAVSIAAICAWYFPRALLYVDFFCPSEADSSTLPERGSLEIWLPRILGVLMIVPISILYFWREITWAGMIFLVLAAAFLAAVIVRGKLLDAKEPRKKLTKLPRSTLGALSIIFTGSIVLAILFAFSHVEIPQRLGTGAIIYYAAASWIAFGSFVIIYPSRLLGVSLIPVLVIWVFVVGYFPDNHDIRTCELEPTASQNEVPLAPGCPKSASKWQKPELAEQFGFWLRHRESEIARFARSGQKYPVFIVAAQGGGIRAGFWTAAILAKLQDSNPAFFCHLYAISGVSGGSIGGSVFVAQISDELEKAKPGQHCGSGVPPEAAHLSKKAAIILAQDSLAPLAAGLLFSDLFRRVMPLPLDDRAEFFEESWEAAWQQNLGNNRFGQSFRSLWSDGRALDVPTLFLNATRVDSGRRAAASNLSFADDPGFANLDDLIAIIGTEIPLSAAAHMGARFPILSPAGRIGRDGMYSYVVDGGYYDNSATLTTADVARALKKSLRESEDVSSEDIALVIIEIYSGKNESDGFWRVARRNVLLRELVAPTQTVLAISSDRMLQARQSLHDLTSGDCYVKFSTEAVLGESDRPFPFAWSLASSTAEKMRSLANQHPELKRVKHILDGSAFMQPNTCRTPGI